MGLPLPSFGKNTAFDAHLFDIQRSMPKDKKLSNQNEWSDRWSEQKTTLKRINVNSPSFRDLHTLFRKYLPTESGTSCIEIGCYPGRYMLYFAENFSYSVSGLEYVPWCAAKTNDYLLQEGIQSNVVCMDFFEFALDNDREHFDVVTSFGFVEHFDDTRQVIQKQIDLLKPGGTLVVVIPNHSGLYGRIMKRIDPQKHKIHNLMDYTDLQAAVIASGAEIVAGGYYGHFGLWNCCLYESLKLKSIPLFYSVRLPLMGLEWLGQIMPNSRTLSPTCAIIAKKL